MKKTIYRFLFLLAKVFPSYIHKDLNKLSKTDKLIVGIRYWLSKNILS